MRAARLLVALALVAGALALAAGALELPRARHAWIDAVTRADAEPRGPIALPTGPGGPGLPPAARTRVVLIDGLAAATAHALPAWSALCARGARVTMDVGFPTVSLPVEVALWSGRTQQQTGVVDNGDEQARSPPVGGIPAQIAGSWAVAEDHGFIVRSLGFARVDAAEGHPWIETWPAAARAAVASDAALVFVHVLRVDHAGHVHGAGSPEYAAAAREADAILGALVAEAPDARWFALSDHGHLAGGGHGGEERAVRQVESCVAGPGVPRVEGPSIHVVDMARALADSTGATLAADAVGRPWSAALAAPLAGDDAVPDLGAGARAVAGALLAIGAVASGAAAGRRAWLWPWWLALACSALVGVRGEPTLSTPMTYAPAGRAMYEAWLPALAVLAVVSWLGARRVGVARALIAQLALPVAALAAAITAAGGWATLAGADVAPVVPRWTAWVSALLLMVAHGCAASAAAVVASAWTDRHRAARASRQARPAGVRSTRTSGASA